MNIRNHEVYREWLALAAAGALEEHEELELREHAASCPECARELQGWQALAGMVRGLQAPQPRLEAVQRAQAAAMHELAQAAERRQRRNALALAVAVSWLVTLASAGVLQTALVRWWPQAGLGTVAMLLAVATWTAAGTILCATSARERFLGRQV